MSLTQNQQYISLQDDYGLLVVFDICCPIPEWFYHGNTLGCCHHNRDCSIWTKGKHSGDVVAMHPSIVVPVLMMQLLNPTHDSPNSYPTVRTAELQSVTLSHQVDSHKTLTTHKLACSCFVTLFGHQ